MKKKVEKMIKRLNKGNKSCSYKIGKNYFIRTATYHCTGKLVSVTDSDFVLSTAAWIADSGRFSDALATGSFKEVEMYTSDVIVNRAGIVDGTEIPTLPTETK